MLPIIGMVDHIKRDPYIRNLASITHIEERVLHEELQRILRGNGGTMLPPVKTARVVGRQEREKDEPEWISDKGEEGVQAGSGSKKSQPWQALDRNRDNKLQWEDYLIGLLVQSPALISHVCVIINDGDFIGTDTRELYHILNSVYHRASSPSNQPFEQFVPSELLTAVARVQKCVESGTARDGAGLVKEAVQCATRLKRTRLLQLNTELKYLLDEAYRAGNTDSMRQLMKQQSEVDHQLRTIDTAVSSR